MAWTQLRFKGEEQHGSTPFKSNNAVVKMAEAVKRLAEYQPPRNTQFIKPLLQNLGVSALVRKLASNTSTVHCFLHNLVHQSEVLPYNGNGGTL